MRAIKLFVSNVADSGEQNDYLFEQERITIGRGRDNHLSLPDEKRIVSAKHAEIRVRDDAYQLIDCGSKNFTYLNGERLTSGQPYALQDGDTFRIGDFELRFAVLERAPAGYGETVFDPRLANPFEDHVEQLAETLEQIRETFNREAPNRRKDALREALRGVFGEDEEHHETEVMISRMLGASEELVAENELNERSAVGRRGENRGSSESSVDTPSGTPQLSTTVSDDRIDRLIQALFRAVARLINIPWRFRHEFIGQTIVQSAEAGFLYEGNVDALQNQLLDDSLSDQEFYERLQLLEDALEDLMRHQLAMIEGYKASAQMGSKKLLDVLDPQIVESELSSEKRIYQLLPLLARLKVVKQLQQRCEELRAEDWSVAERRIYRPTFIKAYLARMTSHQHDSSESHRL
jgi:predicted component of type VI protein secretion system